MFFILGTQTNEWLWKMVNSNICHNFGGRFLKICKLCATITREIESFRLWRHSLCNFTWKPHDGDLAPTVTRVFRRRRFRITWGYAMISRKCPACFAAQSERSKVLSAVRRCAGVSTSLCCWSHLSICLPLILFEWLVVEHIHFETK